ncbi:stage III sporulation protein AD [Cellulosilyticum sp. ST5]|uniref:Stage III sporulation protein AD n=1 Tax=Cellulosilyticum lentocellum (strain ATCC 49066 / DSM 5427 / NCIMB 11756 / RHM5) TaxID=642492 RepID=F2JME4_CELLD|nr:MULTISPECIES: stage III sporulation protein AD [Cellulosilyticum]ADZ83462.1 stage III sporulation protein AD [Cellulosilyticum lentocellum DSM 5427]
MDILKLVAFGLTATLLIGLVSYYDGYSKMYGNLIRIAAVTILMIFIVSQLDSVFMVVRDLANKMNMDNTYLNIVLKVVGIAYLAEFGAQLCEDAGEKAIGSKVQLAGKVMIFVIASPVILALIELITDLI